MALQTDGHYFIISLNSLHCQGCEGFLVALYYRGDHPLKERSLSSGPWLQCWVLVPSLYEDPRTSKKCLGSWLMLTIFLVVSAKVLCFLLGNANYCRYKGMNNNDNVVPGYPICSNTQLSANPPKSQCVCASPQFGSNSFLERGLPDFEFRSAPSHN